MIHERFKQFFYNLFDYTQSVDLESHQDNELDAARIRYNFIPATEEKADYSQQNTCLSLSTITDPAIYNSNVSALKTSLADLDFNLARAEESHRRGIRPNQPNGF